MDPIDAIISWVDGYDPAYQIKLKSFFLRGINHSKSLGSLSIPPYAFFAYIKKALDKINQQAENVAKLIEFDVTYLPGIVESLDQYKASNEFLNIDSYGPTEDVARKNAQKFATALLLEDSNLVKRIRIAKQK